MLPTAKAIESAPLLAYPVELPKRMRSVAAKIDSGATALGKPQKKCPYLVRRQGHLSFREACSSLEVGTNSLEPQGHSSRMGQSPGGLNAPTCVPDQVFLKKSRKLGKNHAKKQLSEQVR